MASVYHIIAIRVNETSWAHVWRLRFCYLGTGCDSNHPTLNVKDILTMSINSIRRSMGLSKHQQRGMNVLGTFLLKMVLGLVRPTLLSSLEKWVKICLYPNLC
jgi:hypothetical protein